MKTYLGIIYATLIIIFISCVSYHYGAISRQRPIYIKYENVSHSLLKSMMDSGIRVNHEQWELLKTNITRGK